MSKKSQIKRGPGHKSTSHRPVGYPSKATRINLLSSPSPIGINEESDMDEVKPIYQIYNNYLKVEISYIFRRRDSN